MEFISAEWEPKSRSWVGGAQDNSVQLSPPNSTSTSRALAYVSGDGTVVAIDSTVDAPRYYGSSQFLGNLMDADWALTHGHDDDDEKDDDDADEKDDDEKDDDDDDDGFGFGFATMDASGALTATPIPVTDWFDVIQFPFFDHPYALNKAAPTGEGLPLLIWARAGRGKPNGFFRIDTTQAAHPTPSARFAEPTLEIESEGDVYTFVAGGTTAGAVDPTVLIGMNDTHLLHRSAASNGALVSRKLPATFARPIEFLFTSPNDYILGPLTHKRTVSLAVSRADSSAIAVSGWPGASLQSTDAKEGVWVSLDGGQSWTDYTANLALASGACTRPNGGKCGRVRPSAVLLLPLASGAHALLVGTINGVLATLVKAGGPSDYVRLGGCADMPLVMVGGLSHEPTSDTLVAATLGRGIFIVEEATAKVAKLLGA